MLTGFPFASKKQAFLAWALRSARTSVKIKATKQTMQCRRVNRYRPGDAHGAPQKPKKKIRVRNYRVKKESQLYTAHNITRREKEPQTLSID